MNYELGRKLPSPRPTAMEAQLAARQHVSIGALGRIIAHNMQHNAIIQDALKSEPPDPNAQPPRVTVQDIFDYHAEKDRTAKPFRSITETT